jgi:hypothetical protein
MIKKQAHHKPKAAENQTSKVKKNKIELFYKVHLSIVLIISLALVYFLILVSSTPKSIPLVTQKIEKIFETKTSEPKINKLISLDELLDKVYEMHEKARSLSSDIELRPFFKQLLPSKLTYRNHS